MALANDLVFVAAVLEAVLLRPILSDFWGVVQRRSINW